jgi:hypothetical protein
VRVRREQKETLRLHARTLDSKPTVGEPLKRMTAAWESMSAPQSFSTDAPPTTAHVVKLCTSRTFTLNQVPAPASGCVPAQLGRLACRSYTRHSQFATTKPQQGHSGSTATIDTWRMSLLHSLFPLSIVSSPTAVREVRKPRSRDGRGILTNSLTLQSGPSNATGHTHSLPCRHILGGLHFLVAPHFCKERRQEAGLVSRMEGDPVWKGCTRLG